MAGHTYRVAEVVSYAVVSISFKELRNIFPFDVAVAQCKLLQRRSSPLPRSTLSARHNLPAVSHRQPGSDQFADTLSFLVSDKFAVSVCLWPRCSEYVLSIVECFALALSL